MKSSRIVLLVSTIGWIVIYFAGFVALGSSPPSVEWSGQEIVGWFTDNATNAQIWAWTSTFAFLALVVFGGQVAALLPKPNSFIFFGGIVAWAITAQVQAWFWAGLAFRPDDLEPATAQLIFDIPQFWGPLINGATMTFAAAIGALGFGASKMIPRWLTWLSVVLFLEQGIETITVFGQSGFIAPGGVMNDYVGGFIGTVWVIGVLVWAYQEMGADAEPATQR